jgi:hypothetical protein
MNVLRSTGPQRGTVVAVFTLLLAAAAAQAQEPRAAADTAALVDARAAAARDSAAIGYQRGLQAARNEPTSQWVLRGFLGGLVLGPVGAGVAYTAANNSGVAVTPQYRMLLLQEGGAAYATSYQDAYAEALRARRKRSALTGGVLGTAALAATITTIWALYYYY